MRFSGREGRRAGLDGAAPQRAPVWPAHVRLRVGLLAGAALAIPAIAPLLMLLIQQGGLAPSLLLRTRLRHGDWATPAALFCVVAACELLLAAAAWPIIRHAVRQGRIFRAMLAARNLWRVQDRARIAAEERRLQERVTAGFAHDINNALGAVLAAADELMETGDRAMIVAARAIAVAADQGLAVTHRIQAVTGLLLSTPTLGDINADLREALTRLWSAAGGAGRLQMTLMGGELLAVLDHVRFIDCVIELLENARAVTPASSVLLLHTELAGAAAAGSPDTRIVVGIEDFGTGMTAEVSQRATDRFFTTHLGSVGLGLSLVRDFVAESGGRLDIRSAPHRGTRVTMLLPAADPQALEHVARDRLREGACVLMVDDNVPMRAALARRLRQSGMTVLEADDAQSAKALLGPGVDALITDIVLPGGVDGLALGQAARAEYPQLALVFVSAFIIARQPELLGNDELACFLRKPVDFENLIAFLAGMLADRAGRSDIRRNAA